MSTTQILIETQAEALVVCACGQELDLCAGSHCPRCGTRLQPASHEGVVRWAMTDETVDEWLGSLVDSAA